jgi:hypothetical protein
MTISLTPRIDVRVELTDTVVIDTHVLRRYGTAPAVGDVHVGGSGATSVRLTGTPDMLRRLAEAALAVADATERAAVAS